MNSYFVLELKELGDERGNLNVVEACKDIPFPIRRVFYDYNTMRGVDRGLHANLKSQFAFISVKGSCTIDVDDGANKKSFVLDSPRKVLVIGAMVWKVMRDFSEDNILLILSDQHYNCSEYIWTYEDFLKIAAQHPAEIISTTEDK